MQVCLNQLSTVQKSQHRLTAVLAMHEGVTPIATIATIATIDQRAGVGESRLMSLASDDAWYRWRANALEGLVDDACGHLQPDPTATASGCKNEARDNTRAAKRCASPRIPHAGK